MDDERVTPTPENPIPDVDEIKPGIPSPAWPDEGGGGGTGEGVLVVGIDMNTMTLDKTWNEINSAPFAIIKMFPDENTTSIALVNEIEIVGGENYKVDAFNMGGGSPSSVSFVATSADGYPVMNMG